MKKNDSRLKKNIETFLPLKKYFTENLPALVIGFSCLLAVDFLQLMIPLIIKRAIDALTFQNATSKALLKFGGYIIITATAIAILRYCWRYLVLGNSRKVEKRLRSELFKHLETLSFSFFQRTKTGDLMARAINDINSVRMAAGMGLVSLVDGTVLGVAAIGFMLYISPLLTCIALIPAPLIIYFSRKFTARMSSGYDKVQNVFADLTEKVREAFAGIRVVKSFQREHWEYNRIEKEGKNYVDVNLKVARTIALFFPMMSLFTNLCLAIIIWLGGRLAIIGNITPGEFVAFIGYLNLLTWPMMAMGMVTNIFQRCGASMRRINRIFNENPEITGPPDLGEKHVISGKIEFEGLTFRYPDQHEDNIKDISLTINAGKTVSVVGKVGSGKTTFLQLIPRLLDVNEGKIIIDSKDIRDYPLQSLRQGIGFVTQDTIIFSDSIRNNVVFGREDVSEGRLIDSLKAAMLYDEVLSLNQGLDSMLGERGITLSGGQRQRLTIARALVSDPPILILDDSLSMVDTKTEEKILNNILEMRQDKTNIIVSHRLSTISRADLIVVLDKGKIINTGDHITLLKDRDNIFSRLYTRQLLARELDMGVGQ